MTQTIEQPPPAPSPPPVDLAGFRRRLVKRLERFRQRVRKQLLLEGAARVAAEALGLLLLTLVLDWWLRLSLPMRLACLLVVIGAIAYELWRHVIRPARMKLSYLDLASLLDRRATPVAGGTGANGNGATNGNGKHEASQAVRGQPLKRGMPIAPRIATVLELSTQIGRDASRPGPSAAMIERAVARSFESLQAVDFDARVDTRREVHAYAILAACLLIPLLVTIVVPSAVGLWAKRWFLGSNQAWPQKTYLAVVGLGDDRRIIVPRGEPYVLRVATRDGTTVIPETVALHLQPNGGKAEEVTMTRFGNDSAAGDFRHEILSVTAPLTVTARGGDDALEPFVIEPVDRPKVAKLALTARHPTDAQPQVYDFSGQAAPSFLAKTRIDLELTSNVPLAELRLKSATTQPAARDLRRLSDTQFALSWTHESAVGLEVELLAREGGLTSPPTPISVGLKVDQPPRVSIQHSGVRQRVTPQARIPLSILARDDYALAGVNLAWKSELDDPAGTTQPVALSDTVKLAGPFTPASEPEIQHAHTMELASLKLVPGSLLSLTGEAGDANFLGPQTGRSRALPFRIVAPEELFREILSRQQGERAKFRKAIDDSKAMRDQLQTVTSPEAAGQVARQYRLVHREVARITKSLSDSLTEMKLNALGGADAHALMENNVLAPLKALHDEAMTRQREALDGLSRSTNEQALERAGASQEAIVAEMERILKQMSQWDSFVDVINQLNEVIKIQEAARESAEKMRAKQTEGVFEE